MLTPHDVHHGLADTRTAQRATVLAAAYDAHPERFVRGAPVLHTPPREVWINPPTARRPPTSAMASETPTALGAADAVDGAEVQGLGGATPVASTEEVLH